MLNTNNFCPTNTQKCVVCVCWVFNNSLLPLLDPACPPHDLCCKVSLRGTCYLLRNNWEVCPGGSLVWSEEEKKTGGTEVGCYMAAQAHGMCCNEEGE